MPTADNKVRFNLKNVYFSKLTVGESGTPTYATPEHIPGAVSISMSPEGDTTPFYADGIQYYTSVANNGYSGDLEMALIPDSFRTEILGETVDETSKVVIENSKVEPAQFALLFEFDGDKKSIRHVLYNCTATRPSMEGSTTTESKEPATETLTITAAPLEDGDGSRQRRQPIPRNRYTTGGIPLYGCPDNRGYNPWRKQSWSEEKKLNSELRRPSRVYTGYGLGGISCRICWTCPNP